MCVSGVPIDRESRVASLPPRRLGVSVMDMVSESLLLDPLASLTQGVASGPNIPFLLRDSARWRFRPDLLEDESGGVHGYGGRGLTAFPFLTRVRERLSPDICLSEIGECHHLAWGGHGLTKTLLEAGAMNLRNMRIVKSIQCGESTDFSRGPWLGEIASWLQESAVATTRRDHEPIQEFRACIRQSKITSYAFPGRPRRAPCLHGLSHRKAMMPEILIGLGGATKLRNCN